MIVDYIDAHKGIYGVEPICRVLTEHGTPIAPSTYYEATGRRPSDIAVRLVAPLLPGLAVLAARGRLKR